jgi:hypothetical protein
MKPQSDFELIDRLEIARRLRVHPRTVVRWYNSDRHGFPNPDRPRNADRRNFGRGQKKYWRWGRVAKWVRDNRPELLR